MADSSIRIDSNMGSRVAMKIVDNGDSTYSFATSLNGFLSSNYNSSGLEASAIISSAPAILLSLNGYNSLGANQYLQFFNRTAVPANGTVPLFPMVIKATDNFYWDGGVYGRVFSSGIVVCNSSTLATKTIGAADCWFSGTFKLL